MALPSVHRSISLPQDLADEIEAIGTKMDRPFSWVIRKAVELYRDDLREMADRATNDKSDRKFGTAKAAP